MSQESPPSTVTIEICLDSVESAVAAQEGGAQRVELCDNLLEGGTTPSAGMIAEVRARITMGLQVMIRPRGGDFCYSEAEFNVMRRDIIEAKRLGADGIVFGILTPDGRIDGARSEELIALAKPCNVTFHRAFDMTRDPFEALKALLDLGVTRVLTSGQEASVLEGLPLITELNRRSEGRIIVLPGCGITPRNVKTILATSKVREIHVVANSWLESAMHYRNQRCFMGTELRSPEYGRAVTDAAKIQEFVERVGPVR